MEKEFDLLGFFGKCGLIQTNPDASYTVTVKNESGRGTMVCYHVFDGIILCYNDFQMYDCYCAEKKNYSGIIEINHCKSGRFECQFTNGKCCYMSEGDLAVNSLGNKIKVSTFPLEYYKGLSVLMDIKKAQSSLDKQLPCINLDISRIMHRLCQKDQCFIARASNTIEHVFSELYHIPDKVKDSYMKIKIVELLVFLSVVDIEDQKCSSSYLPQTKVDKIKSIRQKLVNNLGERYTIEQLAKEFNISSTTLKNYFKVIFGCSIYSYIRNYRIKKAAYYLTETTDTITQIATLLGYANSSKFSAAFKDVMGITPSQYKVKLEIEK